MLTQCSDVVCKDTRFLIYSRTADDNAILITLGQITDSTILISFTWLQLIPYWSGYVTMQIFSNALWLIATWLIDGINVKIKIPSLMKLFLAEFH